jgi:hypothetical protein
MRMIEELCLLACGFSLGVLYCTIQNYRDKSRGYK